MHIYPVVFEAVQFDVRSAPLLVACFVTVLPQSSSFQLNPTDNTTLRKHVSLSVKSVATVDTYNSADRTRGPVRLNCIVMGRNSCSSYMHIVRLSRVSPRASRESHSGKASCLPATGIELQVGVIAGRCGELTRSAYTPTFRIEGDI